MHAQHHKPNPLLPAVDLQLEADSWCLVGVVCCLCRHSFFHILLTLCFSSLFSLSGFGSISPGYFCWKGGKELISLIFADSYLFWHTITGKPFVVAWLVGFDLAVLER